MSFRFWSKSASRPACGLYLHPDVVVLAQADGSSVWVSEQRVAGFHEWPEAVANLLNDAPRQSVKLHIVLASSLAQVIPIDKPAVADEELVGAVPFAVKDLVTEPLHELVTDYFHCATPPTSPDRINVVCCRKQLIQQIVELCEPLEAQIELITTESVILANLLESSPTCQLLLWQAPGRELELQIIREDGLEFSRQLRGFTALPMLQDITADALLLDDLSLELQRSMDYATGMLKLPDISQVHLAITSSNLAPMAQHISQNLTVPVTPLTIDPAFQAERLYLAPALAALREVAP